jgi:hypothetical protein
MQNHPHYAETMPVELRAMIESMAEASKDAPWFAAYDHMRGLWQMADAAFPDEHDEAKQLHGCLVAAVLELMGADPRRVTDPFQAAVYRSSARKDFRKAAGKYLRKIGGRDAAEAKMQEWAAANPVLVKELAGSYGMPGWTLDKVAPRSAEDAVVGLMEKAEEAARANITEQGLMPPFFFAESRDGQQMVVRLNTDRGPARDQIPVLRAMAEGMDWHAGVFASEIWRSDEMEVRPSQSNQRQEGVLLIGLAEGVDVSALFDIERSGSGVELRRNEDFADGFLSSGTPWAAIFDDDVYESLNTERAVN